MNIVSSGTLIKVRLPAGGIAIFDCQPNHVSCVDHVITHGDLLFLKFGNSWHPSNGGLTREPLRTSDDQAKINALDSMPIDFDQAGNVAWGFQVRSVKWDQPTNTRTYVWEWAHPTDRPPYHFSSLEAADRAMRMSFPDRISVPDVRLASMNPETFELLQIVDDDQRRASTTELRSVTRRPSPAPA